MIPGRGNGGKPGYVTAHIAAREDGALAGCVDPIVCGKREGVMGQERGGHQRITPRSVKCDTMCNRLYPTGIIKTKFE